MRSHCFALIALLAAVATHAGEKISSRYHLFAHRGGVVEELFPDNSAAALDAAVQRGYAALEIDIRETKDGVLVMHHDPDLKSFRGDARQIAETSWAELAPLRSKLANQGLWQFEDVVKAAKAAGLELMLDSKAPHAPDFCAKVEAILVKHDMLAHCVIIGTQDALDHFYGKAPIGLKYRPLKRKLDEKPDTAKHYLLFDEGRLTAEQVRWAQDLGLRVVPSLNVYHYYDAATMKDKTRAELEPLILAAARRDVDKFLAAGVTEFQIDSEFDRWFRQ